MALSRRDFIVVGGASLSALALSHRVAARTLSKKGLADVFRKELLPSADEMWSEIKFVNSTMGPSRLTGSPQHAAFVQYLKDQLTKTLRPAGGSVFQEAFANYPRWTATSWTLSAGSRQIPVASYFPY